VRDVLTEPKILFDVYELQTQFLSERHEVRQGGQYVGWLFAAHRQSIINRLESSYEIFSLEHPDSHAHHRRHEDCYARSHSPRSVLCCLRWLELNAVVEGFIDVNEGFLRPAKLFLPDEVAAVAVRLFALGRWVVVR